MRYRVIEATETADGRAHGELECWDASPLATGPNRVKVSVYSGPLLPCHRDGWQPAGTGGRFTPADQTRTRA